MLYLKIKKLRNYLNYKAFINLDADRTGLEPATSAVTGRHSNQLNYRSKTTDYFRECKYRGIVLFRKSLR